MPRPEGLDEDHDRKRPKIDNALINEALLDPKLRVPYFAHEPLNPIEYCGELAAPVAKTSASSTLLTTAATSVPEAQSEIDMKHEADYEDISEIERNINISLGQFRPEEVSATGSLTAPSTEQVPALLVPASHVQGCQPVTNKRIRALDQMDVDDHLIYHLKLAKWTEKEIHKKLVQEGRIGYNQKTIGTRFTRMRRCTAEDTDRRLADGRADWYAAEDRLLSEAVRQADADMATKIRDLERQKWSLVAEHIQRQVPVAVYSAKACMRRFDAICGGYASEPLEYRQNPDEKTLLLLENRRAQLQYVYDLQRQPRPE